MNFQYFNWVWKCDIIQGMREQGLNILAVGKLKKAHFLVEITQSSKTQPPKEISRLLHTGHEALTGGALSITGMTSAEE